jgi:hypothetical protein
MSPVTGEVEDAEPRQPQAFASACAPLGYENKPVERQRGGIPSLGTTLPLESEEAGTDDQAAGPPRTFL